MCEKRDNCENIKKFTIKNGCKVQQNSGDEICKVKRKKKWLRLNDNNSNGRKESRKSKLRITYSGGGVFDDFH